MNVVVKPGCPSMSWAHLTVPLPRLAWVSLSPPATSPWPSLCYSLCRGFRWLQIPLGICWHLYGYWEGGAQGALEGRTRGVRSGWREGQPGAVEGCEAGQPSVPPCHAMAPHTAWEHILTPVPCPDVLLGVLNRSRMSTLQEELL